ncbi:hypothetical protein [Polyangium sp. y55x31]|uniref:hypothetical protein n=1 Tax=Polyangium sp. y55x31 TaxID=3042688 RepID=UPI002482DE61|nr:hypothetical protein [Polyangium sp. y55x31]MDI1484791.1 hypothetical protein [Polyangium sp. y55x31]
MIVANDARLRFGATILSGFVLLACSSSTSVTSSGTTGSGGAGGTGGIGGGSSSTGTGGTGGIGGASSSTGIGGAGGIGGASSSTGIGGAGGIGGASSSTGIGGAGGIGGASSSTGMGGAGGVGGNGGTGGVMQDCGDGVKSGGETDVDCGGPCAACGDGKGCQMNADCQSQVCTSGVCQAPTCSDGVQNGAESGVDCGPGCNALCAAQGTCDNHDDCCLAGRNLLRNPVVFARNGVGDEFMDLLPNQLRASSEYGAGLDASRLNDGSSGSPLEYYGTPSSVAEARLYFRLPEATPVKSICYKNAGTAPADAWLPKEVHLERWDGSAWVSVGDYATQPTKSWQAFTSAGAPASELWRIRLQDIWPGCTGQSGCPRYAIGEIELITNP